MIDRTQLMKGTLEGCILKIISLKTTYGYQIVEDLKKWGVEDVSEGTIYPILLRLEKQGCVKAELIKSSLGPKRKYYTITSQGHDNLQEFVFYWERMVLWVGSILKEQLDDKGQ